MCLTNRVFGIIISLLLVAFVIIAALIFIHPKRLIEAKCKFDNNKPGVCVNSSYCGADDHTHLDDDCNRIDGHVCCSIDNVIVESERQFVLHRHFKFLNTANCAVDAVNGSVDHVVDLGFENENKVLNFSCGGVLINKNFVLTTAQCAVGDKLSVVRRRNGNKTCSGDDNCSEIQKFKIIPHPNFDPVNFTNDIALIKLAEEVKVVPVCLPFGVDKIPNLMNGFGENFDKFEADFVSLPECHESLRNFYKSFQSFGDELKPLYEDSQFCAQIRVDGQVCHGDHGMPLQRSSIIRAENRVVLYGILSFSPRSCGLPGIYTKIQNYLDWILDNVDK